MSRKQGLVDSISNLNTLRQAMAHLWTADTTQNSLERTESCIAFVEKVASLTNNVTDDKLAKFLRGASKSPESYEPMQEFFDALFEQPPET